MSPCLPEGGDARHEVCSPGGRRKLESAAAAVPPPPASPHPRLLTAANSPHPPHRRRVWRRGEAPPRRAGVEREVAPRTRLPRRPPDCSGSRPPAGRACCPLRRQGAGRGHGRVAPRPGARAARRRRPPAVPPQLDDAPSTQTFGVGYHAAAASLFILGLLPPPPASPSPSSTIQSHATAWAASPWS